MKIPIYLDRNIYSIFKTKEKASKEYLNKLEKEFPTTITKEELEERWKE